MEPKKLNKKLQLNKISISKLYDIKGGENNQPGEGNLIILTTITTLTNRITKGDCDMPTIGHDDGSWCISKKQNWCNGRVL